MWSPMSRTSPASEHENSPPESLLLERPPPSPPLTPASTPTSSTTDSSYTFPSLLPNARSPWKVLFEATWEVFRFATEPRRWARARSWLDDRTIALRNNIASWRASLLRWWDGAPAAEAARRVEEGYERGVAMQLLLTGGDLREVQGMMGRREWPWDE